MQLSNQTNLCSRAYSFLGVPALAFCACVLGAILCGPTAAEDEFATGATSQKIKGTGHVRENPGTPDGRDDGENLATAIPIPALPFNDTGNTCDNLDDYDEICPYGGSTAPDVVYSFTPTWDVFVEIDLCLSQYDTKVYCYCEDEGSLVGCNDDYCSNQWTPYASNLSFVPLTAGLTYYIVIDGYGNDCGNYELNIWEWSAPILDCPPDAVDEGEPPLHDGYVDNHNGGCNSMPPVFQEMNWANADGCTWLCGISGWYFNEGNFRDTDWFTVIADGYEMDWTIDAEYEVQCYVIIPNYDCDGIYEMPYSFTAGPFWPQTLTFDTMPGEEYWLWVGPTVYTGPVYEFEYVMTVCGIAVDVIPNRRSTLGALKNLYR